MPDARSTAHPVVAWPFFEVARRLGLPADAGRALLEQARAGGAADARLPHDRVNQLLAWGVELSGRPDLGLCAAEAVEPGHFELVELASRSQRTVGEAIATLCSLAPILHDRVRVSLEQGPEVSSLRIAFGDGIELHPAGYDFIAACLLIAGRRQTGVAALRLLGVALPYARPVDPAYLERFFEAPIRFDGAALELCFATDALQRPLLRSDAQAGEVLRAAAQALLPSQAPPPRTLPRVLELIEARLGQEDVTLAGVARALHLSERTLRRRLQDDGQSFRALLDDVRKQRALEALADERRSTDEVASTLGFTTAQAFHRAFRRWTGDTVHSYRARKR